MPKDTTGHTHADYVYGIASQASRRHAAAISDPGTTPNRAARRADTKAFRAAQFRAARITAAALAFKAKPEPQPTPARFLAAPKLGKRETIATTITPTLCPTRRAAGAR